MAEDLMAALHYAQQMLPPTEVCPWTYERWLTGIAGPETPPAGTSHGPPRPLCLILEEWAHLNERGEWCSLRDIPDADIVFVPIGLPALWRGPSDKWWQEKRRAAPSICPRPFVTRGTAPDRKDFHLRMDHISSNSSRATWPDIRPLDLTLQTDVAALRMFRVALQEAVRKNGIPEDSLPLDRRDLLPKSSSN